MPLIVILGLLNLFFFLQLKRALLSQIYDVLFYKTAVIEFKPLFLNSVFFKQKTNSIAFWKSKTFASEMLRQLKDI